MYGQEIRQRRSFDDIMGEVDAEFPAPTRPKPRPKEQRPSFDQIANETSSAYYGPEIPPEMLPGGKPNVPTSARPASVTPAKPSPKETRFDEAAEAIREIDRRKQRAVDLFREADLTQAKHPAYAQTSRETAEKALADANEYGRQTAKRFKTIEVGFGRDADPKNPRQWVYAKPKDQEVAVRYTRAADADRRRKDVESYRRDYEGSNPISQFLQRLSTGYLSDRPDKTSEEEKELAIRREAMGLGETEAPGVVTDLAGRVARTAVGAIPSAASGVANIADALYRTAQRVTGKELLPDGGDWAPHVEPVVREIEAAIAPVFPTDPKRDELFSSKLASGFGSAAGFGAISKLAGMTRIPSQIAVGTAGAGMGVDEIVREARQAGFDPAQDPARWDKMVALAGASGMTEIFGFGKMLDRWGLKRQFTKRALEVLEEGGQEALQQFLGNVNAAYVGEYDKSRPTSKDILENAIIGGIIGGTAQTADAISGNLQRRAQVSAVASEPGAPLNLRPTVPAGTDTQVVSVPPAFVRGVNQQPVGAPVVSASPIPEALPTAAVPAVTPASVSSPASPTLAQPIAPLFPQTQAQAVQVPNLESLSPQDRAAAMLDQIRQQRQGRANAGLEQQLNTEFTEGAGLIGSAAESWDADRPTAELLATTGAQRLKAALQNLQKSEAYQMELGAVASGAAQPGPYIAAAQSIQQQLDQADSLFRLDAEREREQAELLREQEKQQKKVEKEIAKQAIFAEREQQKLARQLQVEDQRARTQAKRDEAAAKRMETARAAQEGRRTQLEQQREQSRNEKTRKIADAELQRMQLHDAALEAADTAGQRHQEYLNQGLVAEAINELTVQQNQLRDAVRQLPRTPQAQAIKADLNRYQGQIGNRIGDLRKQMRGQSVPVTQPIPPLLRAEAVQNPEGGLPNLPSFYEPGAVFDREVPTIGDTEMETTPLLTTVRRLGGIRADGVSDGELARLGARESGTTGLVNNRSGLSPDRMREALAEEGMLPSDSTVDDLFLAIESEMRAGRRAPAQSIDEFYEQWEAEQVDEATGRQRGDEVAAKVAENIPQTIPARQSQQEVRPRLPIEQFEEDVDPEAYASLQRAIARSEAENPRPYGERTRPGEPGSGLVSFSQYGELERRNVEPERALYENDPTSETFKDAVEWITEDAAKAGIEQRHVDAMIAYALNWHGEKAFWENQGLSMETVQQSADSLDAEMDFIRQQVAELPRNYRTEVEREIAALDTLFDDPDAVNLLERIIQGEDNAADEFSEYATSEHGLSDETIADLIAARRTVRRGIRPRTSTQRDESQSNAGSPATRPAKGRDRSARRPTQRELQLLTIRPSEVFDKDFDAYMTEVEDLYRRAVQGEVDIDPAAIYDPAKWVGVSAEDIDDLRAMGENAGPLAKIRGNRHRRVEENRLPARQNVEIINEYKKANLDQLAAPTHEGRKSRLEQIIQATSVTLEKNPSGASPAWMREVRELHERASAARERYQNRQTEAGTVTHSDPAIDGKPILAKTDDGRVVVENANNKSGVSVVKDRSNEAKDVPDFLNKYGDDVAASLMESDPELHDLLGRPLKDSEKREGLEREDAMRKVTGRIPLLPIAQQEAVYEQLIDEYADALQQAEASGENALEAKTLDLQAETTKTQPLVPGSGASLFEQAANLERVKSNRQGKPFKSDEVIEKLQTALTSDARNLVALGRAGQQQVRQMRTDLEVEVAAYKNKVEEEHGDTKRGEVDQLAATKWLNRWNQITGTVHPGATVQVSGGYGVVLSVERKGKRSNPVALSGWRATIALTDARRVMQVPFSKIDFEVSDQPNRTTILPATSATVYDPETQNFVSVPILEAFDKGLSATKEMRHIVTGNLIAGFGAAPNGQIVNFTDNDGRVRQGIMMPVSFDPADVVGKQKEKLKTVDAVMAALSDARGEVTDREGNLTIRRAIGGGGYDFAVPSAKGRGGKYYLNRALINAAGKDFAKRGGLMEVKVGESAARRMVDVLLKGEGMPTGAGLQAKAMEPKAREQKVEIPDVSGVLADAKIQFKSGKRGRAGTLYANEPALDVMRAAYEEVFEERVDFSNVNLNAAASRRMAEALTEAANDPDFDLATQRKLRAVSREFAMAAQSGETVSIVSTAEGRKFSDIKVSRRHELFHDAQEGLQNSRGFLAKHKYAKQLINGLLSYSFDDRTIEAAAFIAGGQAKDFGLTEAQGNEFLEDYFDDIVKVNGAAALKRFFSVAPHAVETLRKARQKYGIEVQGETGTDHSGASGERETGRPGANGGAAREGKGLLREPQSRSREQKRIRASFGELKNEPAGTVLGSGFGGLQSLRGKPQPKTTPLREIAAEHQPLLVDPYKIQDMAMDEILNASERGIAGTLPGARALYWAKKLAKKKLKMLTPAAKKVADKLADRQANFIADTLAKTNEIIQAHEAMRAAERGSDAYQKARKDFYKARRELHAQLQRTGEYAGPVEYLAKYLKASILTAPHILTNNVLDHLASFPFHEAQKMMGFLLPVRMLRRWGVDVERTHVDFRDLVPAIGREMSAILKGTKDALPDFINMLRYGTTDLLLDEEIARQQVAADEEERSTGGADKYEMGKRAKGVPGLDQIITAVGRTHGAVDVMGRRWAFATAIVSQADAVAKRVGKENGFTEDDIAALRDDLAAEPSPQMIVLAMEEANRFVLDYPTFIFELIQGARKLGEKKHPVANKAFNNALDILVKFQKIPLAAQAQSLWHYTPMGLVGQANRVRRANKAKQEGKPISKQESAEIVERLQQGALGTLAWASAGLLGSLGYLAVAGGDDRERVRNAEEALGFGYDPQLLIGGKAIELNRLGTFGRAGSVAARLAKAAEPRRDVETGEPEPESTRAKRIGKAFMKGVVLDNPVGRGLGEVFMSEIGDPFENFARGQIRSLQPGLLRDVAKVQDGTRRIPDTNDFTGKVTSDLKTGNPWLRKTLQPRLDALGDPTEEHNPFSFLRDVKNNPQLQEMIRLGTGLSKPKRDGDETAVEYNRRIVGFYDQETGARVPGQADQTKKALRQIADDSQQAKRSDLAKSRIYSKELTPSVMKRTAKLSEESVLAEREIEALRADTYEALRQVPVYRQMSGKSRTAARSAVDDVLDKFRARAASTRRSKTGKVSTVREKAARLPEIDPQMLARQAIAEAGK